MEMAGQDQPHHPRIKDPESPAASTPLITTIMSVLPEDQAQTIRGHLQWPEVTLWGSPRKGSNCPVSRALPSPLWVVKDQQVKHSGGPRKQGLPTNTSQMQLWDGHAADGRNSPKQCQERQQMLAVLTEAELEVSDALSRALSLWRGRDEG